MAILAPAAILLAATIIFIPKRLRFSELYATALFADLLSAMTDIYFDVKLNLYGFFLKGIDWEYLLIFLVVYPAAAVLFINFFPFGKSFFQKASYLFGWSAGTLLAEIASLHTGIFYYHGWKWWYSACLYPIIYALLYLQLKIMRMLDAD